MKQARRGVKGAKRREVEKTWGRMQAGEATPPYVALRVLMRCRGREAQESVPHRLAQGGRRWRMFRGKALCVVSYGRNRPMSVVRPRARASDDRGSAGSPGCSRDGVFVGAAASGSAWRTWRCPRLPPGSGARHGRRSRGFVDRATALRCEGACCAGCRCEGKPLFSLFL